MEAKERLYRTADNRVVPEGHPDSAFLLCCEGDVIPETFGKIVLDLGKYGGEKPRGRATSKPEPTPAEPPAVDPAAGGPDGELVNPDETANEAERPNNKATKAEWVAYAEQLGVDPEGTIAELIERCDEAAA